jgi:hypothetical protein
MRRALAAMAALVVVTAAAAQSLDEKMKPVLPTEAEDRWSKLGWQTNIFTALRESGRQNKPVLLWVMNGNPLGCG